MGKTTIARLSFLLRLRVQSDSRWTGQVEQIGSERTETFRSRQQLLERLDAMVSGSTQVKDAQFTREATVPQKPSLLDS